LAMFVDRDEGGFVAAKTQPTAHAKSGWQSSGY
jgi:hypothetical protein